jgi:hypothetical protein
MLGLMKMFGRVLVFGRVAATDVPANHAQPKVHPSVSHLQALFAALGVRLDILDLIQMTAFTHFRFSFEQADPFRIAAPQFRKPPDSFVGCNSLP